MEESKRKLEVEVGEADRDPEAPPLKCVMPRLERSSLVRYRHIRGTTGVKESSLINSLDEMPCISSREPSTVTLLLRQGIFSKTFTFKVELSPLEYITPELFNIKMPTTFPLHSSPEPWLSIGTLEQLSKQHMHTTCQHLQNSQPCSTR